MPSRALSQGLVLIALVSIAASAAADVVRPAPTDCPAGHEPRTGHSGPYCKPPPPASCPAEHLPKVFRSKSYCEPPPAKACPTGSHWTSKSAIDAFCQGGWKCQDDEGCAGGTCEETSLCVREIRRRRNMQEIVSGVCTTAADCPEGEHCRTHKRCDKPNKRAASSPSAAVPVATPPQTAVPESTVPPGPAEPASTGSPTADGDAPRSAPKSTGCGGCALQRPGRAPGLVLWLLALAAAGLRRRRYSKVIQ